MSQENTSLRSYPSNDFIFIANNDLLLGNKESMNTEKKLREDVFISNHCEDIDSGNDSGKSFVNSYGSSSSSSFDVNEISTNLAGLQINNSRRPTAKVFPFVLPNDYPQNISDGSCRITQSSKSSSLHHSFIAKMEKNYPLDEQIEEKDDLDMFPRKTSSKLNIEHFDRVEKLKLSNGENEMLKSMKGTVRGYKNMVRRYSASFNAKGHVIPPSDIKSTNEDKIVIYTTSMTAVRATSDECAYVRKVFQNLGLPFDERDVFIHKEYQKELQTRLGKHLNLPQVIIDGVYIGGFKEVEELNESGKILSLIKGHERCNAIKLCQNCGGKRFINCFSCGGSKKSRKHRINREIRALRCTCCNENGLIPCPLCSGGKEIKTT